MKKRYIFLLFLAIILFIGIYRTSGHSISNNSRHYGTVLSYNSFDDFEKKETGIAGKEFKKLFFEEFPKNGCEIVNLSQEYLPTLEFTLCDNLSVKDKFRPQNARMSLSEDNSSDKNIVTDNFIFERMVKNERKGILQGTNYKNGAKD